jgi:hypothetical protein
MARILVDVRLHDSVSRLSDIDLTYCNTKRSALICLHAQFSSAEKGNGLIVSRDRDPEEARFARC